MPIQLSENDLQKRKLLDLMLKFSKQKFEQYEEQMKDVKNEIDEIIKDNELSESLRGQLSGNIEHLQCNKSNAKSFLWHVSRKKA